LRWPPGGPRRTKPARLRILLLERSSSLRPPTFSRRGPR
jgi:hypothetical protein